MSDTHEFARKICARLDELAAKRIETLIAASASAHDRQAGIIEGLASAKKEIQTELRSWSMRDDEAA